MTARVLATIANVAGLVGLMACASVQEVAIKTPVRPTLDLSPFQRVLVAGFIAGGVDEVDANLELVRLLRGQLRSRSTWKLVDAEVLPLAEIVAELGANSGEPSVPKVAHQPERLRNGSDLERYSHVFANVMYWRKLGEEYQQPLIVTGTVLFTAERRSSYIQREQEAFDSLGRRRVVPVRSFREEKVFVLKPTVIFVDGRTGETLQAETFREETVYDEMQKTPALSVFFELSDRLMPRVLASLSSQDIPGFRNLLK